MLKLIIDEGNTLTKLALFQDIDLIETLRLKKNLQGEIASLVSRYGDVHSALWASVKNDELSIPEFLHSAGINRVLTIRSGMRLPLKVTYKTPETLGSDRLANACGAWNRYPEHNILVVDFGTCIKFDLVTADATYPGGSISPGLLMRFKALSRFTGKLPYLKPNGGAFPELTGQSTEGSIRSGVEHGMLAEANGICEHYLSIYKDLKIIITGGDHVRFADKLKSTIFVAPNLTLEGFKVILDHNDL